MRRLLLIAGIAAAMLIAVPLQAQMRGGRPGFSGRPSFAARSGFGASGPRFNHFAPRFGGGFGPRFGAFGPRFGHGFCRFCGGHFFPRDRFFFGFSAGFAYPYYGFYGAYGYPWWYGGYSYPAYSYPAVAYSDNRYNSDLDYSYQQKRNMEELDRLEDRVRKLEDQRASANVPRPPQYEAQTKPALPIVLIFRDKHTQEAENYAIVGRTIWLFNEQRATRVPLSEIDVAATERANQDRGIDLHIDSRPPDQ